MRQYEPEKRRTFWFEQRGGITVKGFNSFSCTLSFGRRVCKPALQVDSLAAIAYSLLVESTYWRHFERLCLFSKLKVRGRVLEMA